MRLFSSWLGVWPKDLPRLYPELDDRSLATFLTDAEYERILAMPIVVVLPLASEKSTALDRAFGTALARMIIHDLMLVGNLSIHDAEDCPPLYLEQATEVYRGGNGGAVWVTGEAHVEQGLCSLNLSILRPKDPSTHVSIRGSKFKEFLTDCAATIADALGGKINAVVREGWTRGRPSTIVELIDLGKILIADLVPRHTSRLATQLWGNCPNFSLAFELIENEFEPNYRAKLLDVLRRDPGNAALHLRAFSAVRETKEHEPYALQFARKAIEISAGYGRAHIAAAQAAHPEADMLRHLEIGYRLLPGSRHAACHYLAAMCRAGRPVAEINPIVRSAININPYDPANYHAVIETLMELKQFRHALEIAKGLQQLFEPEIHPRTRMCLERDPKVRQQLVSGEYDPVHETRALLRELRDAANFAG